MRVPPKFEYTNKIIQNVNNNFKKMLIHSEIMSKKCIFTNLNHCTGSIVCSACKSYECDCEEIMAYACNQCCHKICNWCGNSTLERNHECAECCDWDYVGDVCESDFCINYLGGRGNINSDLVCNKCQSQSPIIRVPLAFPLQLDQILTDYPNFETIKGCFLKYYSYSHTTGIWEPYPQSEFRLAQEYFDLDAGIIVLGRSRDDEDKAKNNDLLKIEKSLRKMMKKERRLIRLEEKNSKLNQILGVTPIAPRDLSYGPS